ncbi:MAG: DUF1501 domain-containing protein [Rubricoccaceae bacterium]
MCTSHSPVGSRHPEGSPARADALHHGDAHDKDHLTWSRRDFLTRAGLGTAAASVALGSTSVQALTRSPFLDALAKADTDRVLVLIQLTGGNDGLNTIVPVTNDLYYAARPTLGLKASDTLALDAEHGMHASMAPLQSLWGDGQMAVVQNVGYPAPSLSHFRSTDIWMSGSDGDDIVTTGWAGRALANEFPDILQTPPAAPPAVQIGTSAPLLFQGDAGGYGMALLQVEQFLRVAEGGDPYPTDSLPPTAAGAELGYVRTVANDAFRYRDAIQTATNSRYSVNEVDYPDVRIGERLAAVARLIKGDLGARIYLVSLGGFDTHAQQADEHATLLDQLASSLSAFYADLGASGDFADRTLTMTFSEFGRRIQENGSEGTDHGTAAPVFLFGPAAEGGLYGPEPDLDDLDNDGNLKHAIDFREVYASVLKSWFEMSDSDVTLALGGSYDSLPIVSAPPVSADAGPDASLTLAPPAPNPASSTTRLRFALAEATPISLTLFDASGRRIAIVTEGLRRAGDHAETVDLTGFAPGAYTVQLRTPSRVATHRLVVVR